MLSHANSPTMFWVDAMYTATYLINRLPTPILESHSPYYCLLNKTLDYSFLKVLGCACYPNLSASTTHKLSPRSKLCVFLGYASNRKGYRCYNPVTHKAHVSRHMVFDEYSVLMRSNNTSSSSSNAHILVDSSPVLISISQPLLMPSNQPSLLSSSDVNNLRPSSHLSVSSLLMTEPSCPSSTSSSTNSISSLSFSHEPVLPLPSTSSLSSSSTSQPAPTRHPMQTCSKLGIHKPKHLLSLTRIRHSELTCFTQAVNDVKWQMAMSDEFNALLVNHT